MALSVDVLLELGETSTLFGTFTLGTTADTTISAAVDRYVSGVWTAVTSIGPFSQSITGDEEVEIPDIGDFSYTPTTTGVYRWEFSIIVYDDEDVGTTETSYAYFEVTVVGGVVQPILAASVYTDASRRVRLEITESDAAASNRVFVRRQDDEYDTEPTFTRLGDGSQVLTLGTGRYFAKVVSIKGSFTAGGRTDPIFFAIYDTVSESESEVGGETKNIQNVEVEGITNPFFGNQFLAYFLKVPQIGYYQDPESRSLKSYVIDRINETIRGVQLPETSIPMMGLPYFGHQNEQYMGVGDGELGQISIRFLLDRYLQNYTSLLNWSYLKYDWTSGGKNPDENFDDRDLRGILIVEFLDADESRTRKLGYKVIIDSLPGLSLAVDSPEQVEFETLFRVVDIDTSQFIMGSPLKYRVRIHGDSEPSQLPLS